MRERLLAFVEAAGAAEAASVCDNVTCIPEFRDAACVALFASLPDEVSTRPLFDASREDGKRCLLPRVIEMGELEFAEVARWEDLRRGRYDVPEPPAGSIPASLSDASVVVVPGVAFDGSGGRLGRGAGYYDRALSGLDRAGCLVIGVGLARQRVDEVPRGDFDQIVDVVVTEREVLRGWSR